jgi:tetratricopeptide (TPR) repeat protein
MKIKRLLIPLLALALATSCTVSKQMSQLNTDATLAFDKSDYSTALNAYDSLISLSTSRGKEADGTIYRNAGIAAWEVGQTQKSLDYLEKAKELEAANGLAYFTLAKAYLKVDNLSREIINLGIYVDNYPNGDEIDGVRCQLYLAYVKSENWDLAVDLWNSLNQECKDSQNVLMAYLKMLRQGDDSAEIMSTAEKILQKDSGNTEAMEALAIELFNNAEAKYQSEMKAYQKNQTMKQYRQLNDALKTINADFKRARDYFEKLYRVNPDPRYATYLGNIYTRFSNKQKADYYYGRAKQ